jgi:putative heme iron utilization protein
MPERLAGGDVAAGICRHMNEDHADALLLYARTYGDLPGALGARMTSIDADGMDLAVRVDGVDDHVPARIVFDHPLRDADDARRTLIAMVRRARTPHAGG